MKLLWSTTKERWWIKGGYYTPEVGCASLYANEEADEIVARSSTSVAVEVTEAEARTLAGIRLFTSDLVQRREQAEDERFKRQLAGTRR